MSYLGFTLKKQFSNKLKTLIFTLLTLFDSYQKKP